MRQIVSTFLICRAVRLASPESITAETDGTGGTYWLSSPPSRAMMDTEASRGIADSLPLTSLALNHALLRWGLFDSAMAKVGFYFKSFVYANGTIDMGHCKIVILSLFACCPSR